MEQKISEFFVNKHSTFMEQKISEFFVNKHSAFMGEKAQAESKSSTGALLSEQRAQVSFEYLLTAVFAIMIAISAAIVIEALRTIALKSQAQLLSTRSRVIENIFSS